MNPSNKSLSETSLVSHQYIIAGIFVFFFIFWVCEKILRLWSGEIYTYIYFLLPLYGGLLGLRTSKLWGGRKSALGLSILGFALGLLMQTFGQLVYTYYILILNHETPYPSLGDLGYFGSIFCYIFAVYQLAIASGSRYSLKSLSYKIIALFLPFILLAISYLIFINGQVIDTTNSLKLFLDLGYPFGQSIYISLALLALILSSRYLGGALRKSVIIILCGLITQYVADFMFLYQASRGTWQAGDINDLIYLIAYFLTALAIAGFYKTFGDIGKAINPTK